MSYLKFKPLTAELNYTKLISKEELSEDIMNLLDEKETLVLIAKATRDLFLLTDKRIMIVDYKGVSGFHRQIFSLTYRSITTYALKIGTNDTTMELVTDSAYQLIIRFSKPIPLDDMYRIYKYISRKVLN